MQTYFKDQSGTRALIANPSNTFVLDAATYIPSSKAIEVSGYLL